MDLEGVISVTGKPGLHKVVARSKGGLVVESLVDGKRQPIFASNQVSALEDVSIYSTDDENILLADIFKAIFEAEAGKKAGVKPKDSADKLSAYFLKVVPTYDADRVYTSHIKKVISWYNLLLDKDLMVFDEDKKEEKAEKKAVAKKAAPKKEKVKTKAPKAKSAAGAKQVKMPSRKG